MGVVTVTCGGGQNHTKTESVPLAGGALIILPTKKTDG